MKMDDFEKIKHICDANGLELVNKSPKENDKYYVVKVKDVWVGVENPVNLFDDFKISLNYKHCDLDKENRDYVKKTVEEYFNFLVNSLNS